MKLSEIKSELKKLTTIAFQLPNGDLVPNHFHVTEVGVVHKNFIDCGGVVREENKVNFQLWQAEDFDHVLSATKLLSIIQLSENKLHIGDFEIEVEYQLQTIGKFNLEYINDKFVLTNTATNCLALDKCGVENAPKTKNSCTPGGGCC